jgi:biotin operon repressor
MIRHLGATSLDELADETGLSPDILHTEVMHLKEKGVIISRQRHGEDIFKCRV